MRYLLLLFSFLFLYKTVSAYPSLQELVDNRDKKEKLIEEYLQDLLSSHGLTGIENTNKDNNTIISIDIDKQKLQQLNEDENLLSNSYDKSLFRKDDFVIKFEINEQIKFFIKYYTQIGRPSLLLALQRMENYYPTIVEILKRYNMPLDLIALPIVESLYNPSAISSKGARGIWQLMPMTAKINGLVINSYIDERSDVYKSTVAAMEYIKSLREMFNDNWDLIIAGYNGGGGYILSQIRKHNTTNFWKMCRSSEFKSETLEFVPRFYAVVHILKNLTSYGINIPKPKKAYFQIIKSKKTIPISYFAKIVGLPKELIEELNPHFLKGFIFKGSNVYVPYGLKAEIVKKLEREYKRKVRYALYRRARSKRRIKYRVYKLRKGDTLFRIGKKYNVNYKVLMRFNGIKDPRNLQPGKRIKIPLIHSHFFKRRVRVKKHVVRKGETLFRISRKYNIKLKRLMVINHLKSYNIKAGQVILIY